MVRGRMKLSALNKWYRAPEGAGVKFIDDDAEHGPACACRRASPQQEEVRRRMHVLFFVACLALLGWAVWFFFIAD